MKSKKVTMLAAALVVAVVALAGVGYAATTYRAETTNDTNTLASTYLTVTQTSGASYSTPMFDKVYFDTKNVTNDTTIKYTPVTTHTFEDSTTDTFTATGDRTGTYALISKSVTLSIVQVNGAATEATMDVSVTNFTKIDSLKYTMVVGNKTGNVISVVDIAHDYSDGKWHFDHIPLNTTETAKTLEVYLFISLANSETPVSDSTYIKTAGFNNATSADSVFTFLLEATAVSA